MNVGAERARGLIRATWARVALVWVLPAALAAPVLAVAGDITAEAWTTETSTDPVELTTKTLAARADSERRGVLLVDCDRGAVFLDFGALLDAPTAARTTFRIRFEGDPAARDLDVKVSPAVPTMAVVDEVGFARELATREAETLHVAPILLAAHQTYSFALDGAASAFASCGLDVTTLPIPPVESDPKVDPEAEGGIVGGVVGPVLSSPTEGVRVFHHSEVQVRRWVEPRYPAEARALRAGQVTCRARVFIDIYGSPERVDIENCPEVFRAATEDALMQSRWYPATVEDRPVRAQFLMAVKFVP